MADIKVAVINRSTTRTDAEVKRIVSALQKQVHRDFAPAWSVDADLSFVRRGEKPHAGYWWLVILDDSDQAEEIGYHEMTEEGLPLGKVFVRTAKSDGVNWTVTASHELLEMLADPGLNLTASLGKIKPYGTLYQYEICDPCQADKFGYKIDGVTVSDFVYPAWFETFHTKGTTQFDHMGHLKDPMPKLLPGGFIWTFDVGSDRWRMKSEARDGVKGVRPAADPPPAGSRRHRRLFLWEWRRSKV